MTAIAGIVVTAILGLFGGGLAFLKWRRDEFYRQHKERREIYEATRNILYQVFNGGVSEDLIRAYGFQTLDAKFLFDEEMAKYLALVAQRVRQWHHAKSESKRLSPGPEKDTYEKMAREDIRWFTAQGDEGFTNRFRPFLKST
jgi:hypothetical protein